MTDNGGYATLRNYGAATGNHEGGRARAHVADNDRAERDIDTNLRQ